MTITTGHCLCGAVTYAVEGELTARNHCHCETCRRATSSPFTTWFTVELSTFRWTGQPPQFFASSPGVSRTFCATCGSPMSYTTQHRPRQIDLYAATLTDSANFVPQGHSFWNERVAWVNVVDALAKEDPSNA